MDIGGWLTSVGLGEYAEAFARNHIDAELLKQLTAEDLKDLGVASLGHRKRLLLAIADLDASVGKTAETDVRADLTPLGDRRPVTILFCDLSGFTALSGTLDPEELHNFVGRCTALVDRIVEGYGGTVDKHIGDAVMALFGAPIAHGDDPLRAVRAALEIHAAIAGLSRDIGRPLEAHLGIASGEVVAAGLPRGGQQDYTVLGEAVNLAARLVALAQPGETLISDTVYSALSGQAECDAREAVAVKGLQHPVRLWNLRGLAAEKRDTQKRLVGRRAELEQFGGILSACLATGKGRLVYIRGDPGIGKTRLLAEMTHLAGSRGFSRHEGLVLDFGIGRGQDAVHAVVRSLLGIEPGAEPVVRSAAAKSAVAENMISTEQVAFLDDLLDLPQTGELQAHYDAMDNAVRNRGREEVIAALVRASSQRYPLLISVEDLHWADATILSLLAAIARTLPDGPALLVAH